MSMMWPSAGTNSFDIRRRMIRAFCCVSIRKDSLRLTKDVRTCHALFTSTGRMANWCVHSIKAFSAWQMEVFWQVPQNVRWMLSLSQSETVRYGYMPRRWRNFEPEGPFTPTRAGRTSYGHEFCDHDSVGAAVAVHHHVGCDGKPSD